jgi:hypothetical protein
MSHLDMTSVYRDTLAVDQHDEQPAIAPPPRRVPRPTDAGPPAKTKAHITCQFRDARAMVYDLNVGERKIEVRMEPSGAPQVDWKVALIVKGEAHALDASAATRPLAFTALEQISGALFARDDWDEIREALSRVRAL